ncbi:MAG: sporulation protein YtfJ [Rhodobacter sp.]|nr:sporulation protein YtfJ [Rhodobacter sp.]
MDDIDRMLKGTVAELDKLLNARNVLGDPIDREGATVIPIVSYGFGFGIGGGTGGTGTPGGQATGAGGGIKPVGAIIIDKDGARVESVRSPASGMAETLGNLAIKAMNARAAKSAPKDDADPA